MNNNMQHFAEMVLNSTEDGMVPYDLENAAMYVISQPSTQPIPQTGLDTPQSTSQQVVHFINPTQQASYPQNPRFHGIEPKFQT